MKVINNEGILRPLKYQITEYHIIIELLIL